tara:strand:+ start:535 stop:906 length:372 start_codon:yes stop_codon:yes gene_type:complete
MNRFTLIGNLGGDAKIYTKQNAQGEDYSFAMLNLAVSTPEGKGQTRTDWFSIAVFQPHLVELMQSYGTKGKKLFVEGEMVRTTEGEGDARRDITNFRIGYGGQIQLLSSNNSAADQHAGADAA